MLQELIALAGLRAARSRGEETGLTPEIAFYDARWQTTRVLSTSSATTS
ncbi:MAG: hypothetical protein R3D63_02800 [Paracoccaceae bacterium]